MVTRDDVIEENEAAKLRARTALTQAMAEDAERRALENIPAVVFVPPPRAEVMNDA